MRRRILFLLLLLALSVSALAQQQSNGELAPSIERLRTHVSYLASDKLDGRRTGSAGANAAAEYIAREFARYGLRRSIGRDLPGMSILEADSPRRYMQEFPYVSGVELGKNNYMKLTPGSGLMKRYGSLHLTVGKDWMPLGFSATENLKDLPAVFVGYGLKVDELNYDDYAGVKVANHVVVALAGTPDGDNPHGQFARYADVRWKAVMARSLGARALIIIAGDEDFKDERLAHLRYDNSAGEANLTVVVISRQAAAMIFEQAAFPLLAELEAAARERPKKPAQPTPGGIKSSSPQVIDFAFDIRTDLLRRNAPAYNVAGILEGSDPVLKNEVIVIGAHYDHLGRGGEGSLAERAGEIHHGADDNASGVAGVLELARIFSRESARPKRTLLFVAFSGEEEGLLGSNYFVTHAVLPGAETIAMINMDMIGRMKEKRLMIGGVGTAEEWRKWLVLANSVPDRKVLSEAVQASANSVTANITIPLPQRFTLTLNEDGYGPSDHSSFYAKKVPVLFFFTGTHDDYHKPSDTAEKINYEDEAQILLLVGGILRSIDGSAKRPTYTVAKSQTQGRSLGFRVYLGTIPNYAESNDGLKLDGVREDSPAAQAGLKAGDRIVKMAGREIRNVYDYTYALGEMKAGQEYEVEIKRGTETHRLKITPAARK